MTLDPNIADTDPNAGGQDGGDSQQVDQGTQAPPAERTYTKSEYDREFANARRAWEYQTEQKLARERSQWQTQRQPQTNPEDPWSALDPQAGAALRKIFDAEIAKGIAPYKAAQEAFTQQQEDLQFKGEEADLRSKYPEYGKNRTAVLEYAIANNIANPEAAFHAWRSMTQWDRNASQAVAAHLAKKTAQATRTPSVERGSGAPSSKQTFKDKDGKLDRDAMDEAAKQLFRDAEV